MTHRGPFQPLLFCDCDSVTEPGRGNGFRAALRQRGVFPPAGAQGVKKKTSKRVGAEAAWRNRDLQEQLGVGRDTEMAPANFRGVKIFRWSSARIFGPDPADLPAAAGSLLAHKTPPGSPVRGGAR